MVGRSNLAESAPANLPLLPNSGRVRDRGLVALRSQLESGNALGVGHRSLAEPGSASVVLRLDSADRGVARRLWLVRSLNHAFCLLLILGRTALRVALAFRTVAARDDHRPGARCTDHARCSKEKRCSGGL